MMMLEWLDFLPTRPQSTRHRDLMLAVVLDELQLDFGDFASKSRHPRCVLARRMAAGLLRLRTGMSYPELARVMARNNHVSVITWVQDLELDVKAINREIVRRGAPARLRELSPDGLLRHLDAMIYAEIEKAERLRPADQRPLTAAS